MRIRLYSKRSYAQLDTWSRGTKQSQTKPISTPRAKKLADDLKQKHKKYRAGTSQAADTLTRYISTNQGQIPYTVFRTKSYDVASDAAEAPCRNVDPYRLKS